MPKIVDHDQRRRELAAAALRVIAREGLEGATTRAVAVECGWSTGVLKHYFQNKDELLQAALRELERLNLERFESALHEDSGFEALRVAVVTILRADADESRVWISFISRASTDPATAAIWRRAMESWTARWAELLRRGQADGSITGSVDPEKTAAELHALVNGLSIGNLFRTPTKHGPAQPAFLDGLRPASVRTSGGRLRDTSGRR